MKTPQSTGAVKETRLRLEADIKRYLEFRARRDRCTQAASLRKVLADAMEADTEFTQHQRSA